MFQKKKKMMYTDAVALHSSSLLHDHTEVLHEHHDHYLCHYIFDYLDSYFDIDIDSVVVRSQYVRIQPSEVGLKSMHRCYCPLKRSTGEKCRNED